MDVTDNWLTYFWAILMEKRYQGASEFIRSIFQKKKLIRAVLSGEEERRNKKLLGIVENIFGRL